MGKYIYEGHMGGLYATEEELSFKALYCEQCGDRDRLIGYANNLTEAWELLKGKADLFDDDKCKTCEYNSEEYIDTCMERCHRLDGGEYTLSYISTFLHSEFPDENFKWHFVYVLMQHKGEPDYFLLLHIPTENGFASTYIVPHSVCIDSNYTKLIAKELIRIAENEDADTLTHVSSKEYADRFVHIYMCQEENGDSYDYGWYGYVERKDIHLSAEDEEVFKDIL